MHESSINTVQMHRWMERIRAGELNARDDLLRGFGNRFEALARKMIRRFPNVHRWADTNDVLQNALMRLLRSLEKVEPGSVREFLGLAALVMRRELIDLARHFNGPQGIGGNHASQHANAASPIVDQTPVTQDDEDEVARWQAFHERVEELPSEEREVVGLVFYHGWTQIQIAELFQVSDRTIRRWWESALLKLHQSLKILPD